MEEGFAAGKFPTICRSPLGLEGRVKGTFLLFDGGLLSVCVKTSKLCVGGYVNLSEFVNFSDTAWEIFFGSLRSSSRRVFGVSVVFKKEILFDEFQVS